MVPVMAVAPEYPTRQLYQGVEGWVLVEFDVDRLGRVVAPRVIAAQPARVFDRAALRAVKRYKYRPRVINGQPVDVQGVRQRIVFELTGA